MHTDPLTASRYPDTNDGTNIAQYFQNAVWDLAVNAIPRFATVSARDSAYAAYISAGGTLANGRMCYTDDAGYFQRLGGAWVTAISKGPLSGANGFSSGGVGNYYSAGYRLTADGHVTLRGMFQRTGANVVLNGTGSPVTFATLPAALKPSSDIAPVAYFGSASPVQTVAGRLYCAAGSTNLQIIPMDAGSYTVYTTGGFVNVDGVAWYL